MSEWNCWKNSSDIVSGRRGEGGGQRYIRGLAVGDGKRGRGLEMRVSKGTEMGIRGGVAVNPQPPAEIVPADE